MRENLSDSGRSYTLHTFLQPLWLEDMALDDGLDPVVFLGLTMAKRTREHEILT
jgi:hypothetical protein